MNVEEILNEHLEMIDREIKEVFRGHDFPEPLYAMMKYHLGWLDEDLRETSQYRGKRFRPTICLLTYKALSGVYTKALPAAAAIELIHNFSLIHDDIEDMDEERRHKPTVWKLWGIPQAINVGDGMHVMANLAALQLKDANVTSQKIVEILAILNRTIMRLCEGQYLDMSFEEATDVTVDMYLDMVSRKTGALIEASTLVGASLATEDEGLIGHFRDFGKNIGIAFQIRDDIIGIWGEKGKAGKPIGSDILRKKKTLPVLYAFQKAGRQDRQVLRGIYGKKRPTKGDVGKVLRVLERAGAKKYSQGVAERFEALAFKDLKVIRLRNASMEKLGALANFLVRRSF
ncbi:MAG: polyprenyl synthetase family protein [Candidatus Hydrothermarchaeota archaeon]